MRYLTLGELIELHRRIIEQSGGAGGIRELGLAESAIAQPQMSFGGEELYPAVVGKAAALCYSLKSRLVRVLKMEDRESRHGDPERSAVCSRRRFEC